MPPRRYVFCLGSCNKRTTAGRAAVGAVAALARALDARLTVLHVRRLGLDTNEGRSDVGTRAEELQLVGDIASQLEERKVIVSTEVRDHLIPLAYTYKYNIRTTSDAWK